MPSATPPDMQVRIRWLGRLRSSGASEDSQVVVVAGGQSPLQPPNGVLPPPTLFSSLTRNRRPCFGHRCGWLSAAPALSSPWGQSALHLPSHGHPAAVA